jgi:hypothetical protein
MAYYYFNKWKIFPCISIYSSPRRKNIPCYEITFYASYHYILLMKCSYGFKLYVFENHILIDLLVYEKVLYVFVLCTLDDFAPRLGPRHIIQPNS